MTVRQVFSTLAVATLLAVISPAASHAFCGVIEKSATAKTTAKAIHKANRAVAREVKALRKQYGKKLVLDAPQESCVGGALAIDASGRQIEGNPSCTRTQGFCVNP